MVEIHTHCLFHILDGNEESTLEQHPISIINMHQISDPTRLQTQILDSLISVVEETLVVLALSAPQAMSHLLYLTSGFVISIEESGYEILHARIFGAQSNGLIFGCSCNSNGAGAGEASECNVLHCL